MTMSTQLGWHFPYLRKLASSCSSRKKGLLRSQFFFAYFFLSVFSFISFNSAQAQEDCAGKFSITAQRSYDAGTNKTTYTYTITETGNVNNLSHWGFPICEETDLTVEQLLNGATARYSTTSASGPWTAASTSYGPDNSQNCVAGNVFKFNVGMPEGVTTMYFQLTINGNYTLAPAVAYVKYGNTCCVFNVQGGGCIEEICPPVNVTTTPINVCETGSTGSATVDLDNGVTGLDGGTRTFHSSQADAEAGVNPISDMQSVTAGTSATFWVRSTKGRCFGVASITVSVTDNPDVTVPNKTACESGSTGFATVDLTTGAVADGGTITYYTDAGFTMPIASPTMFNAPIGVTTIYVRSVNGNCVGTTSFTVTVTDNPDVTAENATICAGESINLNTLITNADGGTITFHASQADANNGVNAIAQPVTPGAGVHTYYVRSTNGNCYGTTTITLTAEVCNPFCTYTQGFFGNKQNKGQACTPDGTKDAISLMTGSISNMPGGKLYLGTAGHSFTAWPADAAKLNTLLPGGGGSIVLGGDYTVNNVPNKNGKINNTLLAQTITLALNVYMTSDMSESVGSVELETGWITTRARSATSTCADPEPADCSVEADALQSWQLPGNVIQALPGDKTVMDLLNMASAALGGTLPAGVTRDDIARAVDIINNAFDECRYLEGFYECAVTCENVDWEDPCALQDAMVTSSARLNTNGAVDAAAAVVKINAFPNPFSDRVRFNIQSNVSGKASLVVYNMVGQKVGDVFQGYVFAGRGQVVEYKVPLSGRANLIYIFTINGKQSVGKLINQKY